MKRLKVVFSLSILSCCASPLPAQTTDAQNAVRAAVVAKYHVTQAMADNSDIVTPGDVITLEKSGLLMFPSTVFMHTVSYHDGKFSAGGLTTLSSFSALSALGGSAQGVGQSRKFVTGEKCWLTGVTVKDDGLYLAFLTDAINDVRYMGTVKFPWDKKQSVPQPSEMLARVAEVIVAAPLSGGDQGGAQAPAQSVAAAAPAAEAPPPPIAPPPPPPDQAAAPPPTISLGQTKDTVVANFGQPVRVVKLGTKEIDTYKDMKVTFVNGKVTDVQ